VDPVTVTTTIARPPAEVFEYLADVANHPEFSDHFLVDWHLTREDSYGVGAGARFRVLQRFNRSFFSDVTLVEALAPQRIVATGRGGTYNRNRTVVTWTLDPGDSAGSTKVTLVSESIPATQSDRMLGKILCPPKFARGQLDRALTRLGSILESGAERGARATVSGGARKPASGFRL
jgi:uncharacterized protein YndB with AHSA1/START domain